MKNSIIEAYGEYNIQESDYDEEFSGFAIIPVSHRFYKAEDPEGGYRPPDPRLRAQETPEGTMRHCGSPNGVGPSDPDDEEMRNFIRSVAYSQRYHAADIKEWYTPDDKWPPWRGPFGGWWDRSEYAVGFEDCPKERRGLMIAMIGAYAFCGWALSDVVDLPEHPKDPCIVSQEFPERPIYYGEGSKCEKEGWTIQGAEGESEQLKKMDSWFLGAKRSNGYIAADIAEFHRSHDSMPIGFQPADRHLPKEEATAPCSSGGLTNPVQTRNQQVTLMFDRVLLKENLLKGVSAALGACSVGIDYATKNLSTNDTKGREIMDRLGSTLKEARDHFQDLITDLQGETTDDPKLRDSDRPD
jgi:hypothetical protein